GHTEEPRSLHRHIGGISYSLHQADCLEWMALQPAHHVHAIVTDPPYGLKEYTHEEKKKLRSRHGGSGESRHHTTVASVARFLALRSSPMRIAPGLKRSSCRSPK